MSAEGSGQAGGRAFRLVSVGATVDGFQLWIAPQGSDRCRALLVSEREALGLIATIANVLKERP